MRVASEVWAGLRGLRTGFKVLVQWGSWNLGGHVDGRPLTRLQGSKNPIRQKLAERGLLLVVCQDQACRPQCSLLELEMVRLLLFRK